MQACWLPSHPLCSVAATRPPSLCPPHFGLSSAVQQRSNVMPETYTQLHWQWLERSLQAMAGPPTGRARRERRPARASSACAASRGRPSHCCTDLRAVCWIASAPTAPGAAQTRRGLVPLEQRGAKASQASDPLVQVPMLMPVAQSRAPAPPRTFERPRSRPRVWPAAAHRPPACTDSRIQDSRIPPATIGPAAATRRPPPPPPPAWPAPPQAAPPATHGGEQPHAGAA